LVCFSWSYSVASDNFTFVSGSALEVLNATFAARYETIGVASATALPLPRFNAIGVTDAAGSLWLLMGAASVPSSTPGYTSFTYGGDVWSFNVTSRQWTWWKGAQPVFAGTDYYGNFSTFRQPSPSNHPPGLQDPAGAIDVAAGLVFIQGGVSSGPFNALWMLNLSSLEWSWMAGGSTWSPVTNYPPQGLDVGGTATSSGVASEQGAVWVDAAGNIFYGFGGVWTEQVSNGQTTTEEEQQADNTEQSKHSNTHTEQQTAQPTRQRQLSSHSCLCVCG
jgi:hypothetical protein